MPEVQDHTFGVTQARLRNARASCRDSGHHPNRLRRRRSPRGRSAHHCRPEAPCGPLAPGRLQGGSYTASRRVAQVTLMRHWRTDWGRCSLRFSVPAERTEPQGSSPYSPRPENEPAGPPTSLVDRARHRSAPRGPVRLLSPIAPCTGRQSAQTLERCW